MNANRGAARLSSMVFRMAVTAIVVAVPRIATACPVCFGENDSPLASGINYGILAMLVIVVGLWVAFASFFVHLRRRARMDEALSGLSAGPASTSPEVTQGGTI